ncbi:acetylxylan esterase [Schlesneria sp. T3-172]|uniref:alpha/beta hydrolase family protein n=1 Tax=Schlesneria sphaerica TaxID=3373610 RepID=UPI0037C9F73A
MHRRMLIVTVCLLLLNSRLVLGQDNGASFLSFIKNQAQTLRAGDVPPASMDDWKQRRAALRENLLKAWGGFPETDCDLSPQVLGTFQREGYRVEKLVFQTRPGVWMTANAYVPDQPGKRPAILQVHGHWAGAKQDPAVQSRCIGSVKLGYFVLCVDAFGSGERAVGKALGEYHGEMTAATVLPVGLPLSGLQVYENRRAVDYLRSRPEVDPDRIGITGASGGGNQTMYAGAFDERLKCVVPTCSVGNYQAYLGAACCFCEVVPGALRFTEEGDVLGLAANRGLMVTSATKDAFQFSVDEARKSVARAEAIARLFGTSTKHTIIESPHDYNQEMREAMYGWMAKHLKGEGDGSPIPEPPVQPEPREMLLCYPNESRPDDYLTIPRFAATEAIRLAEQRPVPADRAEWEKARPKRVESLIQVLGGQPERTALDLAVEPGNSDKDQKLAFNVEPGLRTVARRDLPEKPGRLAIVLDLDGGLERAWSGDLATRLRDGGWAVVTPELRATGQFADPRDKIGHAPDHNTAEWSIWIGRPLLGQWVWDVRRTLDAIAERDGSLPHDVLITGQGTAGLVALCAAALDQRITRVTAVDSLGSYVTDQPYRGLRMGLMVPGILRDFGDVGEIAALVAPRPVTIQGGVSGGGQPLDTARLTAAYSSTRKVFELLEAPSVLLLQGGRD